ncbi:MAG: DUF2207 domain-containing protein [Eubacterium sp.]|nr:DUF2207 domain-containing protein [Eubacterium sp.]
MLLKYTRLAAIALMVAAAAVMLVALSCVDSHAASDFRITDYDIDMTVNEDDTYLIHETLQVEFTAPSHGIYYVVPLKTTLERDGQKSVYYAKVKDFEMISGQPYKNQSDDGQAYYRIGDPNAYADTQTTYEYSYIYDTGGDHFNDGDEVYHNLVGASWEAQSIDHVSFRVTFPKDIDMNNVGIKNGDQLDIPFETEGNTVVYGETDESTLRGLTIRAVLPDGYFTRQAKTSNVLFYVLVAILAVIAVVGIVLWRKYGVDPKIVEPVEFYPPEGLSAPEVGYLSDGTIKGDHVVSILLSLADKGYLKIVESHEQKGKIFKHDKTTYTIVKEKEYDGKVIGEAEFMRGLFKNGRDSVTVSELNDSFYKTVNSIKKKIEKKYEKKLTDEKAADIAGIMRLAGFIGMIALVVVSKLSNGSPLIEDGDWIWSIINMIVIVVLPICGFYGIAARINSVKHSIKGVLTILACAFAVLAGFVMALSSDVCIGSQIVPYLIGMAMIFVIYVVAALCERKSDYYAKVLGEIRGYRNFLKTAEKERLEALAEEDHDFFYKTLAFAFALGVTSVFAKKFSSIAVEPPKWYESDSYGSNAFSTMTMMNSISSMMNSASSSMTSSPSSSGSGGGSFSGGGGGGGGSW